MSETTKQNSHSTGTTPSNGKSTKSFSPFGKSHGKSKFAQKSRGKSKAPVAVKRGPVNAYTSVCCGLPATKPGCVKVDKKKALEQGLGSWRCSGCHKAAKVTVGKPKAPEAAPTPTVEVPVAG